MGLDVSKVSSTIANSKIFKKVDDNVTPFINRLTENPIAKKIINAYEPTGGNNSFLGLSTIMTCAVILPRIATAKKRNPDNKEATADEVREILLRDVQTVGIILFALKIMDTLAGRAATKIKGLPLTNKAYRPVFKADANLKFFDRVKNFGKNILDTINPVGGIVKYTNDEITSRYSNYESMGEIRKLFREFPAQGGDNQKIFDRVVEGLIESQEKIIEKNNHEKAGGVTVALNKAKNILEKLKNAKNADWEIINDSKLDKDVANKFVDFFKDPNNSLVTSGKKLGAVLRTIALAIEVGYLGFGLPALNQRRLEKKYLSGKDKFVKEQFHNAARGINSSVLVEKNIKPREIELFHNFMK